jgi:hypothetical protein
MSKSKVSWGIVITFIGIYIFAYKLGAVGYPEFKAFLNSWPILLIVYGINLIIPGKLAWLEIILVIALMAFATYFSLFGFRYI